MKFDYIIGNPPYQDDSQRNNGFAAPVYHAFIDESYKIADVVELIHPARFLFNAGSTPKEWNQKMLNDNHLKILFYEKDSSIIFDRVDIKGGIAISLRNSKKDYGAIETFTAYSELNGILEKIKDAKIIPLSDSAYVTGKFDFDNLFADFPDTENMLKERRLATNVLEILDNIVFTAKCPEDGKEYVHVYGRIGSARASRWILRKYIDAPKNIDSYKVFLPKVNGIGQFGETFVDPFIGQPAETNTHTFMSIGNVRTRYEGESLLKYIKTKYSRALLGILKITQHNSNECWKYVPLQDFTENSDIDWTKSIPEIDQQLYKKYGLDNEEIAFIESHVKEMA